MFDANMRHLPEGFKFFSRVNRISKKHALYKKGVRLGNVLKATMLDKCNDYPKVELEIKGKIVIQQADCNFDLSMSYEGYEQNGELMNFINDDSLTKARKLLINE